MCRKLHKSVATVVLPISQGGGFFVVKTRRAAEKWQRQGAEVIYHP